MPDLSEQNNGVTVLRRRARSDLFAAVSSSLVGVTIIVWGGWNFLAFERLFPSPILGFLFLVLGIPAWLAWSRNRARLRDLTTPSEDAGGLG